MVISPSLMYPEGVANTNISLAIAEVPLLMIDCDEGSQQMQDLWENSTTLDGEALQNTHTPHCKIQWFFQGTNITNQPWRAIILGYRPCQYQDLFTEFGNPTTQAQGIWNGLNIETQFYIIYPLCAHHLRPFKTLKFRGILPKLPIIGQCRPCLVPATDLRDQVGPEKPQVLKSLVWSQPNFLNRYFDQPPISQIPQKNDLINSRSALPKTWSFSGYPHFHPDPSGHNVSIIPPFNHIILYKSI